jgi:aminopeptidase YwaD
VYLITGSEEAGLRGAKAYARRHRREWQDVETIVISLDTMRDLPYLYIFSRDQNGLVAHDPRVCRLLQDAGRRCGLELRLACIFIGSSDAAAFSQAGIPAAALCAMDPHPAAYYHNRRDNWDNMDPLCIRKTAELLLAAIEEYDVKGLAIEQR